MEFNRKIGLATAIFIIIADVIGTGIFMTTGNLLGMTKHAGIVLVLWSLGGLVALTGALSYARLAARWPENGGEYIYLKNMFGMLPAFLTGWVSLFVGFSASVALAAITMITYMDAFFTSGILSNPGIQKTISISIVSLFGFLHIVGLKKGSIVQNILTILKIIIVASIILFGIIYADWSQINRLSANYSKEETISIFKLGIPLLMVMFAFSGWNGANYIAGEMKDARKNLPKALLFGVLSITIIYLLMNIVFLISSPFDVLKGKDAVGQIATQNLFGTGFGKIFAIAIALILLSSVSVQMMVGPRIYQAMAEDKVIFGFLKKIHPKYETPYLAIIAQIIIAAVYIILGKGNIMKLLVYMGFALNIFPVLCVIGLIKYQLKENVSKIKLIIPLTYITLSVAMMTSALIFWTKTSLFAVGIVVIAIPIFFIWKKVVNEN